MLKDAREKWHNAVAREKAIAQKLKTEKAVSKMWHQDSEDWFNQYQKLVDEVSKAEAENAYLRNKLARYESEFGALKAEQVPERESITVDAHGFLVW